MPHAGLLRDSRPSARCGRKTGGDDDEALGRSRGRFSTTLHIAVEAGGRPVEMALTAGQAHDVTKAAQSLADHKPKRVIADKGYDCDALVASIRERRAQAVVPSRSRRRKRRHLDRKQYRRRNRVERFVNRIKQFRRIATRYDRTARNFLAFVPLAATLIWAGSNVNTP